jgi:hypothetical protein
MRFKVALLILVQAAALSAGNLGVDFTGFSSSDSSVRSLGYQFEAVSAAAVTRLGVFDYGQDGLPGAQQVGLWHANGALLASGFVDNNDPLQGFWRFHGISAVTLTPGARYFVASQGGEGYAGATTSFTVNPNIIFVRDAWGYVGDSSNTPLKFPDITSGVGAAYGGAFFGGNIEFEGVPTPEPATFGLIGSVLAGLGLAMRRRRTAR